MRTRNRISREIRGGKVVYVTDAPVSAPAGSIPKSRKTPRQLPRLARMGTPLAIAALGGAAAVVVGVAWLSIEAIVNPDVSFWLNQYLPSASTEKAVIGEMMPQTLKEIQADIRRSGQSTGAPLVLASDLTLRAKVDSATDVLIPVFSQQAGCENNCQQITELRLYRALQIPYLLQILQAKHYFRLLDRMTVVGPEETDVIASPNNPKLANYGSTRTLPLTELGQYDSAPTPGVWLRLTGLLKTGDTVTTYGQILYFNSDQAALIPMLNWSSPLGEIPSWQEVTGKGKPELVINQSVGLQPEFAIYQNQAAANGEIQLQAISLAEPALKNASYADSLTLARSGLWSPALTLLKQVKQLQVKRWSQAAQAQLDYIQMHAQITRAQAEQPWVSPVQRVLAYLSNGSWTPAVQVFQASSAAREDIRNMLLADTGELFSRVAAALTVNPAQPDAIAWGAMVLAVQQGKAEAIAWLRKREMPNSSVFIRTQKLLQQLDRAGKPANNPDQFSQKLTTRKPTLATQELQLPPSQTSQLYQKSQSTVQPPSQPRGLEKLSPEAMRKTPFVSPNPQLRDEMVEPFELSKHPAPSPQVMGSSFKKKPQTKLGVPILASPLPVPFQQGN